MLPGKKGLLLGIANQSSIAYDCAGILHRAGAGLAVTYLNAKAKPCARPLAGRLANPVIVSCDVREPGPRARTPEHQLVSIEDVGNLAAFLVSDGAAALTRNVEYIDTGYHVVG